MRPHSLDALCDGLGNRVHFGMALELAAVLAPALFGVEVVTTLFCRSLRRLHLRVRLWIGTCTCSSARSRLVKYRSCGRTPWWLSGMPCIRICFGFFAWTCASMRSRLVQFCSGGCTLRLFSVRLWAFESTLDCHLVLQQRLLSP
jgi:hypothetical protein